MEANHWKQGYPVSGDITGITCIKKHYLKTEDEEKHSFGSKPAELKVGFLYEIDHKQLPRKSPLQLEGIRAVMVTEVNDINVTVRSPSSLSLRAYFQNEMGNNLQGRAYPELDRQFTMGLKLAKEILVRQIPPPEFIKQRHLQSFWLLPFKITNITPAVVNGDSKNETSAKGLCWESLVSAGLVRWGVRRRITYFGRNKEKTPRPLPPPLSSIIKEEEVSQTDIKPNDETKRKIKKRKCEDYPTDIKPKDEMKRKTRKRKHDGSKHNKKSKVPKLEVKKPSDEISKQKLKVSYGWWSQDRYKSAEVKMFAIMKAKGAVHGKPILRQALRLEARKHIGDTGLLDHVLKHMADKVAPNGEYRFRRRHNADGAMEYWLESANLVNVRREAGVKDPYWTPPPGWKPGDNPSHDPNWARELKLLKEQMFNIKKDVQELQLLKSEDEVDKAIVISTISPSESCNLELDFEVISLQEDYDNLIKRKIQVEQQISHIRKGKHGDRKQNEKTHDVKREAKKLCSRISEQKLKLSYGRWSQDRYKSAEVKMWEVMKAKGAVAGKPILRQTLRMDVRKHIGDTGLLDHILKHMADKVAPNGIDRFRRRHNADGAMEYWLESADLVNLRREAGVKDPYWTPPLGWKPGDNPSQAPNYARELKLLKEEMSNIEKDVQELLLSKREDSDKAIVISTKSSSESCSLESDTTVVSFQEDHKNLGYRKGPNELHYIQLSESFNGIQDSIHVGNNFNITQHDATPTSGIHEMEQETIASYLVGSHHTHASGAMDLNNFFRTRPCDFVTGQSLDTEQKDSSYCLLV